MTTATLVHGTNAGYVTHGCRCADCIEAKRLYMREWRARHQSGTFVMRNKVKWGRPLALDIVARRVGDDFPAVGLVRRSLAVMSA